MPQTCPSFLLSDFSQVTQGSSIKGNVAHGKSRTTLVTVESLTNDNKGRFLAKVLWLWPSMTFSHTAPRLHSNLYLGRTWLSHEAIR